MVNWDTDHFTFRSDEEARRLIRRNKEYLEENYSSTTELVKEGLRYVDEQNGTIQDKIERLKEEEKQHKKKVTDKRQRRKELQERKEKLEKERRKKELEEKISKLSEYEGKTQEDIEEEIIQDIIDHRSHLETREDVLDSKYASQIQNRVEDRLEKVEKLNEFKKELAELEV